MRTTFASMWAMIDYSAPYCRAHRKTCLADIAASWLLHNNSELMLPFRWSLDQRLYSIPRVCVRLD